MRPGDRTAHRLAPWELPQAFSHLALINACVHLIREDGLIFDAVRIWLPEIGEAVKAVPAELLDTQPSIPGRQIAGLRTTWPTATSTRPRDLAGDLPRGSSCALVGA